MTVSAFAPVLTDCSELARHLTVTLLLLVYWFRHTALLLYYHLMLLNCYWATVVVLSTCSTWYSLSWVTVCYRDLITFKVQFTLYMTIYYHLFLLYMSLAILDNIVTCYCCYRFLSWLDFSHRAILDSSAIWTMYLCYYFLDFTWLSLSLVTLPFNALTI